jgi:hypothetical protein
MTINIFNDDPSGRYIFPVFTTGGAQLGGSAELQAWFCKGALSSYATTKLSRIYINASSGIAPGKSVSLTIPLFSKPTNQRYLGDSYIDWWTGDTIELFFSADNSGAEPRALIELVAGTDPNNPSGTNGTGQQALTAQSDFPTCKPGNTGGSCNLQFFVDTASLAKFNPSQLIEFNLGALQASTRCQTNPPDANNPACANRHAGQPGAGVPNALDIRNVDIDMSYVNVAFAPATLAPLQNDQTGFVGTPQPFAPTNPAQPNFSTALSNFINSSTCQTAVSPNSCNGWPQFVHTYADKTKQVLLKLASPLEAFGRLSPPTDIPPPDLCGFTQATPCDTPAGNLQWPSKSNGYTAILWPPIQALLKNWVSLAGTLKDYPKPDDPQTTIPSNLPTGTCNKNGAPTAGTFCAAIMDIKTLIILNYNQYVSIMNDRRCAPVPLNDNTAIAHVYGWTPFIESNNGGCHLDAADNLLQNTPSTPTGKPSTTPYAPYQQVKNEFDKLNYNQFTDNTYIFNPWVGCDKSLPSVPPCSSQTQNGLIHGSNFVNARNAYAYSVDDAVGNLQSEGGGFIIDVGSSQNLCTGPTPPCANKNLAGPPLTINLSLNFSSPGNIYFTNYGLCQYNSDDKTGTSYKSVNTLSQAFIINATNPSNCPVFLADSNSPPQLYTFTVTAPPAQTPNIPPPYNLVPPDPASSADDAKYIDCSGNKPGTTIGNATYQQSSPVWCCKTEPNSLILGVWARSQPNTTTAHRLFDNNIITTQACPASGDPNGNCQTRGTEAICSCGKAPVQGSGCPFP